MLRMPQGFTPAQPIAGGFMKGLRTSGGASTAKVANQNWLKAEGLLVTECIDCEENVNLTKYIST